MPRWSLILALLLLGHAGCSDRDRDAGLPDAATSDAGASDAGASDSGTTDAGPGPMDAGPVEMDAGPGETDAGPVGMDAGTGDRMIPDPGAGMDEWAPAGMINVPPGHGTPETAWLVGTVTEDPWYIGGVTDAVTGDVFWVFRTSATTTTISIPLRGAGLASIDYLHLHDGAGLVFGAEVTPDSYVVGMDGGRMAIDATWTVLPDHIYVVEVHGSMGTFF